eukprot:CAMPEP_0201701706 /NCGR_PEP_ID=MMETSP0578-20130828/33674_1 /ASSEMBLY_ACC=CAM_ASM_000663 /TAXON_ID=267565 /ORGANISM="Skeletonema grethea, Strain CCMP 1804" /LENGTH=317 /DNA_ID=CAMNT_0048189083 /DNA_START=96 /DNA_END=1049 /DNA_ORIENTATION=-
MVSISSAKGKKLSSNTLSPSLILCVISIGIILTPICHVILIARHLSTSDNASGVGSIRAQQDNNPQQQPYDGIFVISLQGTPNADPHNEGRLDSFKDAWRKHCGADPEIHVCPGVMDERRGYGLTRSWFNCLTVAKNLKLEVTMIFEDDARLFDNEASHNFCDAEQRRRNLWNPLPEDTFIAFLGGHTWTYKDPKQKELLASSASALQPSQYLETSSSYGTYGFAVPRQSLDTLLNTIKSDLTNGFIDEDGVRQTEFLSPEKSWYGKAREVGSKIYAIHPLAVWHEGGFSNTWKMDRESITGEEEDEGEGGIRGIAE